MATNSPERLLDLLETIWGGSPLLRALNRNIIAPERIEAVQQLAGLGSQVINLLVPQIRKLPPSQDTVPFHRFREPTACEVLLKIAAHIDGLLRIGVELRKAELEWGSQERKEFEASPLSFPNGNDDCRTVFSIIDDDPPPSTEEWVQLRAELVRELRMIVDERNHTPADDGGSAPETPPAGNPLDAAPRHKPVDEGDSPPVVRSPESVTDRQLQNIRDEAARRVGIIRQLHRHLVQVEPWRGKGKLNDSKKNVRNWIRRDWDSPLKGQKQAESKKLPWRFVLTEATRIKLASLRDELEPKLFKA